MSLLVHLNKHVGEILNLVRKVTHYFFVGAAILGDTVFN